MAERPFTTRRSGFGGSATEVTQRDNEGRIWNESNIWLDTGEICECRGKWPFCLVAVPKVLTVRLQQVLSCKILDGGAFAQALQDRAMPARPIAQPARIAFSWVRAER